MIDKPIDLGVFNISVIGETKVGKTTILNQFLGEGANPIFEEQFLREYSKDIQSVGVSRVTLNISDTSGDYGEKSTGFAAVFAAKKTLKKAAGVVLVFDLHVPYTFDQVSNYWLKQINERGRLPIVLIGNNKQGSEVYDIDDEAQNVSQDQIDTFIKENNLKYFEINSKDQDVEKITEAFNYLLGEVTEFMKVNEKIKKHLSEEFQKKIEKEKAKQHLEKFKKIKCLVRCPICNLIPNEISIDKFSNSVNIQCTNCKYNKPFKLKEFKYLIYSPSETTCMVCNKNTIKKKDMLYCHNCFKFVCSSCTAKHLKDHGFDSKSNKEAEKNLNVQNFVFKETLCRFHLRENENFCDDCGIHLCKYCNLFKHSSHKVIRIIDRLGKFDVAQARKKLKDALHSLEVVKACSSSALSQLQKKLLDNYSMMKNEITLKEGILDNYENIENNYKAINLVEKLDLNYKKFEFNEFSTWEAKFRKIFDFYQEPHTILNHNIIENLSVQEEFSLNTKDVQVTDVCQFNVNKLAVSKSNGSIEIFDPTEHLKFPVYTFSIDGGRINSIIPSNLFNNILYVSCNEKIHKIQVVVELGNNFYKIMETYKEPGSNFLFIEEILLSETKTNHILSCDANNKVKLWSSTDSNDQIYELKAGNEAINIRSIFSDVFALKYKETNESSDFQSKNQTNNNIDDSFFSNFYRCGTMAGNTFEEEESQLKDVIEEIKIPDDLFTTIFRLRKNKEGKPAVERLKVEFRNKEEKISILGKIKENFYFIVKTGKNDLVSYVLSYLDSKVKTVELKGFPDKSPTLFAKISENKEEVNFLTANTKYNIYQLSYNVETSEYQYIGYYKMLYKNMNIMSFYSLGRYIFFIGDNSNVKIMSNE